jgi:uncharacterized protein (DUF433 family)
MVVMKIPEELKDIVISDPERMSGVPCFVGTRVPVYILMEHVEAGLGLDQFLECYSWIPREHAEKVLMVFAADIIERYSLDRAS